MVSFGFETALSQEVKHRRNMYGYSYCVLFPESEFQLQKVVKSDIISYVKARASDGRLRQCYVPTGEFSKLLMLTWLRPQGGKLADRMGCHKQEQCRCRVLISFTSCGRGRGGDITLVMNKSIACVQFLYCHPVYSREATIKGRGAHP